MKIKIKMTESYATEDNTYQKDKTYSIPEAEANQLLAAKLAELAEDFDSEKAPFTKNKK